MVTDAKLSFMPVASEQQALTGLTDGYDLLVREAEVQDSWFLLHFGS